MPTILQLRCFVPRGHDEAMSTGLKVKNSVQKFRE